MIPRTLLRLRLRPPITTTTTTSTGCSPPLIHRLTRFAPFSSAATHPNYATARTAVSETTPESEAYLNARKHGRPSTVTWSPRLHNSVCLIGYVDYPLKQYDTRDGRFGVCTSLRVQLSSDSQSFFSITLEMWDELAERALLHLRPNDYIYISGELGSYTKSNLEGIERLIYKVTAKELNYVKLDEPEKNSQKVVNSGAVSGKDSGESSLQKFNNRLHLWQVLFASPDEWYDRRKNKKNPKGPDFKHKSTGEALWLNASDPPWVKKQVELLDSRRSGRSINDGISRTSPSRLFSDEEMIVPGPIVTAKDSDYNKLEEPAKTQSAVNSGKKTGAYQQGSSSPKHNDRLNLWQKVFTNPAEWYDQRKSKKSQREPDFKHKSTGEELWLNASDPLWVKNKVALLDSRLSGAISKDITSKASSTRVSDEKLIEGSPTVKAKNINNVKLDEHHEPGKDHERAVMSSGKEIVRHVSAPPSLQKQKNRLHMLQRLFANPNEWYDQRRSKKNPKQPDFKNCSTGEAIWLNTTDPPWVQKQVELLDSKRSGRPNNAMNS